MPQDREPVEARGVVDLAKFDGSAFLREAIGFTRELRGAGLTADLAAVLDFVRALSLVDVGDREQVRAAGATLFVRRHEDLPTYHLVFARYWRRRPRSGRPVIEGPGIPAKPSGSAGEAPPSESGQRSTDGLAGNGRRAEATGDGSDDGGDHELVIARTAYSGGEALRHRDFEQMSSAELREAERLIDRITPVLDARRTRRWELHSHGRMVALRPMLRENLATGGDPITWLWRRPVRKPRSVVVICDISGSMERHSRLLLRFAYALMRSRVRTEAFVFGTRLTRVTRQLRGRDPDVALERVASVVRDWSGGTRIGESFREFNVRWARRVLRTSGIVIVVSDGWDRGSPELVGEETARLRRNCHRLVWLNPLAGAAGYRPLAAGMAAAYPYIDDFLPANDLASLEALGELLASPRGPRTAPGATRAAA